MTAHEFTLVLADPVELTDDVVDCLYEAGCDDATIASRGGRVFLDFSREAESLDASVLSATADVRKAGFRVGGTVS